MRGLSRPRAKLAQSAAFRPHDPLLLGGCGDIPFPGELSEKLMEEKRQNVVEKEGTKSEWNKLNMS